MGNVLDNDKYEDLVWKNSRVFAKRIDKVLNDEIAVADIVTELVNLGINQSEMDELRETLDDPNYEVDTMGYNDGPGLGKSVPFDEGVYETLKEVFRRIHNDEIYP